MIVVDRVEGDIAIVEVEGVFVEIPLTALPEGVTEGSHLAFHLVEAEPDGEADARLERLRSMDDGAPIIDL